MKAGVLVIGSGPAGLAAAACLRREGVDFQWADRSGLIGGAYRLMYGAMQLASPRRYSGLPGFPLKASPGEYVSALEYRDYLKDYAAQNNLNSPEKAEVERVERESSGFQVHFAGGSARYRNVVVATGMFDNPYRPMIAGLSHEGKDLEVLHSRDWPGPERFEGRKILIIGRGTTAVEIAEECAKHGPAVTLSARKGKVRTLPQRILGRDLHDYAVLIERLPVRLFTGHCRKQPALPGINLGFWRLVKKGLIQIRPEVEYFKGRQAVFQGPLAENFDVVILATGYRYAVSFLPETVERMPAGHPATAQSESVVWPGLYFMGFPCARGLDSQFLRGMAHDAPIVARKIKERLH